jgi:hypothetical protein
MRDNRAVFLADSILYMVDEYIVSEALPFCHIQTLVTDLDLWEYAESYILPALVIYHAAGGQNVAEAVWLRSLLDKYSSAELRVIYDSREKVITDVLNEPPRWASGDEGLIARFNDLSGIIRAFVGASEDSWLKTSSQHMDFIRGISVALEGVLSQHFTGVQVAIKSNLQMQTLVQGNRREPIYHDHFSLGWLALITKQLANAAKYRENELRQIFRLVEVDDSGAVCLLKNLSRLDQAGVSVITDFVATRNKIMHKTESISFQELTNLGNLAFKLLDKILALP